MNFALLFFITLFTGILASQPSRTEIKARYGSVCNAAGTIDLCGTGTTWKNATAGSVGQCVPAVPATEPEPEPEPEPGCMDPTATNYNSLVTIDDGNCDYTFRL